MNDGEHIHDFHHSVIFKNDHITFVLKYRVLKHIVEQRKRDGYSQEIIQQLFTEIVALLELGQYEFIPSQKEVNHFLFIELVQEKPLGIVVVAEVVIHEDGVYVMKTGFYRASSKIKKLLRKTK